MKDAPCTGANLSPLPQGTVSSRRNIYSCSHIYFDTLLFIPGVQHGPGRDPPVPLRPTHDLRGTGGGRSLLRLWKGLPAIRGKIKTTQKSAVRGNRKFALCGNFLILSLSGKSILSQRGIFKMCPYLCFFGGVDLKCMNFWEPSYCKKRLSSAHMGADFFPEGERMPQKLHYPQKLP